MKPGWGSVKWRRFSGCISEAGSAEGLTHSKCAEAGLHRSVKWSELLRVARLDASYPFPHAGFRNTFS